MKKLNYNLIFKGKFGGDVYNFEILVRHEKDFYPQIAGFIIVNLKTKESRMSINIEKELECMENFCEAALLAAEEIAQVIEGKDNTNENKN